MDMKALKAAKALIEVAARRAGSGRADPKTVKARTKEARENRALARRELVAGGLDPKRLDVLAAKRAAVRQKRVEQTRQSAIKASAAVGRRLGQLTPILIPPADPMNVIIDRVTFIRSFAGAGSVADSEIHSLNSWARYRLNGSAGVTESGTGRLSFFTLWQNPRNEPVVVTTGARLVVNAHLSVDAEWQGVADWFIGGSSAQATVRARTTVWAMDSSQKSIVHDSILAQTAASGGFFGDDNSASIAFNEFLSTSGVVVAARAYILIEVELRTEWTATNGSIALDAASGSFKVSVPHLILSVT
jgi:hypothetical protein